MSTPNYWGFRTNWRDPKAHQFLYEELKKGNLRQGWGGNETQNLRSNPTDRGARANLPIYNRVKKGDYLLIPHMPSYPYVTIVQASQDFSEGYQFQIDPERKDYGHIFPIEKTIKVFARGNVNVHADIRNSLRNPMRFWCMSRYGEYIQKLINTKDNALSSTSRYEDLALDNMKEAIRNTLNEDALRNNLRELFEQSFQSSEWEFAIRKALELILPHCYVKRVGGKLEKDHGCDLAVFMPSIERDLTYVIGIQIKDYKDVVNPHVIEQINKADDYWTEDNENGCALIDKYLIIIDSTEDKNVELEVKAQDSQVRILYRDDVLELLSRAAKIQMANNL